MHKISLALSLIFLFLDSGFAQNNSAATDPTSNAISSSENPNVKNSRIEFSLEDADGDYQFLQLGKEGFLVFYKSEKKAGNGMKNFCCIKYDTNMNMAFKKTIPINDSYKYITVTQDQHAVYVLYGDGKNSTIKSRTAFVLTQSELRKVQNLSTIKIDYINGDLKVIDSKFPKKVYYQQCNATNDHVYISGVTSTETKNRTIAFATILPVWPVGVYFLFKKPVIRAAPILDIDTKSESSNMIVIRTPRGNSFIMDANVAHSMGEYYALIKNKVGKSETYQLKTIELNNNHSDQRLSFKKNNRIQTLKITTFDNNLKVMCGMYSSSNVKEAYFQSTGLFIAAYENSENKFNTFLPYKEFRTFSSAYTKTYKKNAPKPLSPSPSTSPSTFAVSTTPKMKDDKTKLKFLVHDIIKIDSEYVVVAEGFYEAYHTEIQQVYSVSATGSTMPQGPRYINVFDGYAYTQALIAGFSLDGKLLWDNGFEMGDFKSFQLKERVTVQPGANGEFTLVYSDGKVVNTKFIRKAEVVEDKQQVKVETLYKNDKEKDSNLQNQDVQYWYENNFVVWGVQKIKGKKKRTVFYVNKMSLS